ncbi:hypothetical protein [Promicromonospora sukumoe]|uniref:Cytochrome P450 n=1 Tax=Promicromonospora sukumoe TaxID=88382 RepID=A0A7W3J7P2_9MICO|nr:hypothetical protein [Promicromonospora sukumoe]MBA8807669.1 cytochrome P450 [Promicromonospora sukumoe]
MVTTETTVWNGDAGGLPAYLRAAFRAGVWQRVETSTGTEHARLRAPLDDVMAAIDAAEIGRAVRAVCGEMVSRLVDLSRSDPGREVDLMREYVEPVARLGFGTLLGVAPVTARQLFELASDTVTNQDPAGLDDAVLDDAGLGELSFPIAGQAMRDASGGMTPAGLLAAHHGYRGIREAVLGTLSLVSGASAGLQAWLGQALLRALTNQAFARRLAGGRLGTDDALEAVLWDASPVSMLAPRFALQGGHLVGKAIWIEPGDAFLLAVGAAACDPHVRGTSAWDGLGNRAHLAWGAGSHRCPASGQARLIVRTAVETVLRHVEPSLTIDANQITWALDLRFRRPTTLPATLGITRGP